MNKPKHTLGPWNFNTYSDHCGWSIFAGEVGCIAERWYTTGRTEQENEEMYANGRLVSAAPDLYEALKACHLQMLQSNNDSEYAQEANQMAIAAIAKAEGKQP